jgi:hypothetical protein
MTGAVPGEASSETAAEGAGAATAALNITECAAAVTCSLPPDQDNSAGK